MYVAPSRSPRTIPAPIAGEFRAVIADDQSDIPRLRSALPARSRHGARDRGVRRRCQALPGNVLDHVENTEPSSRSQLIVNEVQAPPPVRQRKHRSRSACSDSTLAAASSSVPLDRPDSGCATVSPPKSRRSVRLTLSRKNFRLRIQRSIAYNALILSQCCSL